MTWHARVRVCAYVIMCAVQSTNMLLKAWAFDVAVSERERARARSSLATAPAGVARSLTRSLASSGSAMFSRPNRWRWRWQPDARSGCFSEPSGTLPPAPLCCSRSPCSAEVSSDAGGWCCAGRWWCL
eukprot:6203323-Pleurochrysis_carterae.AAC.1